MAGEELLNANPASFDFIVLVTDGDGGYPVPTAERIRAGNTTTIFAVGVGVCARESGSNCKEMLKVSEVVHSQLLHLPLPL